VRTLLLFNPEATSVSPRVRDVIARALSSQLKVDLVETKRRNHATHLARGAAHEGYEAVAVLGGDGTVNEVINGLAGTDVPLIPIPGGGTNVFARTLGLPPDPVEATAIVIEKLQSGVPARAINLGSVNGRAFGFNAGVGYDAAVVHAVERRFLLKKKIGQPFFVAQAFRVFFTGYPRKHSRMVVRARGETIGPVYAAVVCNSDPYTFLGARPFHLCPDASFDEGLDLTTLTKMHAPGVLRLVARAFAGGSHTSMRFVRALHDLDSLDVESEEPLPYQVDGDYAGEATRFHFESLPRALRVIA
jgi:diacylglycerol kinase family enzyme